jgi:hypothetical protein
MNAAHRFRGEPYSTEPGRTSTTSGYKDCSGLIVASLTLVGIRAAGTVSTTIEEWARSSGGRYLSRAEAQQTPGCCAAIWGSGAAGHIGFGNGDGRIFETKSAEGPQAGFSPWDRNRWGEYFTLPGISYGGDGAPSTPQTKVTGMLCRDRDSGKIYLIGPGHHHHVTKPEDVARMRFIGVPYAGDMDLATILGWIQTFGAA